MEAETDTEGQVQVRFTTDLPERFRVPPTTFSVPANLTRYGLSEVVNALLSDKDPTTAPAPGRAFDFVVGDVLLRTSLRQCLLAQRISTEAVVAVKYSLAFQPPDQSTRIHVSEWVGAVCASFSGVVLTGCFDGSLRVFVPRQPQAASGTASSQNGHQDGSRVAEGGSEASEAPAEGSSAKAGLGCCQVVDAHSDAVTALAALRLPGDGDDAAAGGTEGRRSKAGRGRRGGTGSAEPPTHVATASKDRRVRLWRVTASGEGPNGAADGRSSAVRGAGAPAPAAAAPFSVVAPAEAEFVGHTAAVQAVVASPSGQQLCTGGWDATVRLWPLPSAEAAVAKRVAEGDAGEGAAAAKDLGGWEGATQEGSARANGRVAAAKRSRMDAGIQVSSSACLEGHTQAVSSLAWLPGSGGGSDSSALLASASWDHSVRLWDVQAAACAATLTAAHPLFCLAASPASSPSPLLASAGAHPAILLWDQREAAAAASAAEDAAGRVTRPAMRLLGHSGWISALAWCPSSPLLLLSSSFDGSLKLWDVRSTVPVHTIKAHTEKALCAAWCPWQQTETSGGVLPAIASGGADCELRLFWQHSSAPLP